MLNPVQIKVLTSVLSPADYGMLTLITIAAWELAHLSSAGHYEYIVQRLPGRTRAHQLGVLRLVWRCFGAFAAVLAGFAIAVLIIVRPASVPVEPVQLAIAAASAVALVFLFQRIFLLSARAEWVRVRTLQLVWSDTWFVPVLVAAAFMSVTLNAVLACWLLWLLLASLLAHRWIKGDAGEAPACPETIAEILRFSVPLLPMMLGLSLVGLAERYLLAFLRDVEAVARYSLSFSIALVVYAVGAAVLDLFVPHFNKECNRISDGDLLERAPPPALQRILTTMLRYSLLLALTGGLFLTFCARELVAIVSTAQYAGAARIVPFLAVVPLLYLLWSLFNRILLAGHRTRFIGLVTLIVTFVNIVLNVVLIPHLGEIGCALAFAATLVLLAAATGAHVRIWRWIVPAELMPWRLGAMTLLNSAGVFLAQATLGPFPLLCILAAGGWCLVCIIALRLIRRDDWSALELAPVTNASRAVESPSS